MKKLGCDNITVTNLGINQYIKSNQIDVVKELRKHGYKLYDEIPFGVIRDIAEYTFDLVVNQNNMCIEFWGEYYPYEGDDYSEYEMIAKMTITDLTKNSYLSHNGDGYVSTGHIEDICAYAKYGDKLAEFPRNY